MAHGLELPRAVARSRTGGRRRRACRGNGSGRGVCSRNRCSLTAGGAEAAAARGELAASSRLHYFPWADFGSAKGLMPRPRSTSTTAALWSRLGFDHCRATGVACGNSSSAAIRASGGSRTSSASSSPRTSPHRQNLTTRRERRLPPTPSASSAAARPAVARPARAVLREVRPAWNLHVIASGNRRPARRGSCERRSARRRRRGADARALVGLGDFQGLYAHGARPPQGEQAARPGVQRRGTRGDPRVCAPAFAAHRGGEPTLVHSNGIKSHLFAGRAGSALSCVYRHLAHPRLPRCTCAPW